SIAFSISSTSNATCGTLLIVRESRSQVRTASIQHRMGLFRILERRTSDVSDGVLGDGKPMSVCRDGDTANPWRRLEVARNPAALVWVVSCSSIGPMFECYVEVA